MFDGRFFVRLDSRVPNMFDAAMRITLAQRLVSIVSFVFRIKHVLTVLPVTSTLAYLVTKQCLMVFGRQNVCPGPKRFGHPFNVTLFLTLERFSIQ